MPHTDSGNSSGGHSDQRRHGRLRCEYLSCFHNFEHLGEVLDLSAAGMRVSRRGGLKLQTDDWLNMRLVWQQTVVDIRARVIWIKKAGFRKSALGLEFESLTPAQRASVTQIARLATHSRMIADAS